MKILQNTIQKQDAQVYHDKIMEEDKKNFSVYSEELQKEILVLPANMARRKTLAKKFGEEAKTDFTNYCGKYYLPSEFTSSIIFELVHIITCVDVTNVYYARKNDYIRKLMYEVRTICNARFPSTNWGSTIKEYSDSFNLPQEEYNFTEEYNFPIESKKAEEQAIKNWERKSSNYYLLPVMKKIELKNGKTDFVFSGKKIRMEANKRSFIKREVKKARIQAKEKEKKIAQEERLRKYINLDGEDVIQEGFKFIYEMIDKGNIQAFSDIGKYIPLLFRHLNNYINSCAKQKISIDKETGKKTYQDREVTFTDFCERTNKTEEFLNSILESGNVHYMEDSIISKLDGITDKEKLKEFILSDCGKMSKDNVSNIIDCAFKGMKQADIARATNINVMTVSRYIATIAKYILKHEEAVKLIFDNSEKPNTIKNKEKLDTLTSIDFQKEKILVNASSHEKAVEFISCNETFEYFKEEENPHFYGLPVKKKKSFPYEIFIKNKGEKGLWLEKVYSSENLEEARAKLEELKKSEEYKNRLSYKYILEA